jgi:hypothetical protein
MEKPKKKMERRQDECEGDALARGVDAHNFEKRELNP